MLLIRGGKEDGIVIPYQAWVGKAIDLEPGKRCNTFGRESHRESIQ